MSKNQRREVKMLKCPKCETSIEVNLPTDSRIKDMADLSRQRRRDGGIGVIKCGECDYEGDPLEFDPRSRLPKIVKCLITTNGNVMAFDDDGNQIPECQGFILVVASQIKIRSDENTVWLFGNFRDWLEPADFSWWYTE